MEKLNCWKPDSATKKMLKEYRTCGYIYKDGIVVVEHRKTRIAKDTFIENEIAHVWHYNTGLQYAYNGDRTQPDITPLRVVIHQPDLLLDGVSHIRVCYHNGSETTRKEGKDITSTTLTTGSGLNIHVHNHGGFATEFCIQPDPVDKYTSYNISDSVDTWITDQYITVVRHTEKEVIEQAA